MISEIQVEIDENGIDLVVGEIMEAVEEQKQSSLEIARKSCGVEEDAKAKGHKLDLRPEVVR